MVLGEAPHPQSRRARDVARDRLEISEDDLEEGRLADAVGSHQRDSRLHVEAQVDAREEWARRVVTARDVHQLQDWRRERLGVGE